MDLVLVLVLVLSALILPATAAAALATQPAATAPDWTARVERTAEGGYRMGNPDAALKLVEYGSVTCSHCADFAVQANDTLKQQVRSGRLSFEYRPYIIFPSDPGIFLLLGCQAPDRFFTTLDSLYASQSQWVARIEARQSEFERLTSWAEAIPAVTRAGGLDQVFQQQGLSAQQVAACLADSAAFQRLAEGHRRAQQAGVEGTPTFFLNGRKIDAYDWAGLAPHLRQP